MEPIIPENYLIYKYLRKCFIYRGLTPTDEFLDFQGFMNSEFGRKKFSTIDANDNNIAIHLGKNNNAVQKVPSFKKFIQPFLNKKITLVVPETFLERSVMLQKWNELKNDSSFIYPEHIFMFNVPNHFLVPKHEIISKEELENLYDSQYLNKSSFPLIYYNDPPVAWLGAVPGDVIKITEQSRISGKRVNFRLVIK